MGSLNVSYNAPRAQVSSTSPLGRTGGRLLPFVPKPYRFFGDNDLIDHFGPKLGLEGVGLYCALQRYANRRTGQCWPSVATLARQLGTSQPRIRKYLHTLKAVGLVDWEARYSAAGDRASNLYTVHPATRPADAPEPQPLAEQGPNDVLPPLQQNPSQGGHTVCHEQDLGQGDRTRAEPPCPGEEAEEAAQDDPAPAPQKAPQPTSYKVVQLTPECLTHDVTPIVQHRAEVAAIQREVQALDSAMYSHFEAQAWENLRRDPDVHPAYVSRVQLELCMYDLYQAARLAEAGQRAGREEGAHVP